MILLVEVIIYGQTLVLICEAWFSCCYFCETFWEFHTIWHPCATTTVPSGGEWNQTSEECTACKKAH